jgi:Flp pilus assembly protein TadG
MLRIPRRAPRKGERGTALIEFALVLPLLVVVTFLVIDFSRAFMVKNVLTQAAREGARSLAVSAVPDSADTRVRLLMTAAGVSPRVVTLEPYYGTQVRATVTGSVKWLYPGLLRMIGVATTDSLTLTGACTMYREY